MNHTQSCIKPYTEHRYTCSPYDKDAGRHCSPARSSPDATKHTPATASSPPAAENVDERVRHIITLMEAYLHRNLNLNEMANHVNLSLWHLSHLFKSEVGMPPAQFLKCLRLNKAKELLETTFLNIKEIKNRVGIKDESHFARSFKKAFGLAPAQHRTCFLNNRVGETAPPVALTETASE